MNTQLIGIPDFPFDQPFNDYPWYYSGDESVTSLPNNDIVDWVLIELRDASDITSAIASTIVAKRAAFLLSDGSVVGLDGSSPLHFELSIEDNLFVAVYHRNHLGVISAYPLSENSGSYFYNFTTAADKAYTGVLAHKDIGNGIYGLVGGDGDKNGTIDMNDKLSIWQIIAGMRGYEAADYDLDGQIANRDKNDIWINNLNYSQQIP